MLFNSFNVYSCSCYSSESFNLAEYDWSVNILTVYILSKVDNNYDDELKEYEKLKLNWNESYPIYPMYPRPMHNEVVAEILEIFKGKLKKRRIILRSEDDSCSWIPKIGETYLLYLGKTHTNKGYEFINVNACTRKVNRDQSSFMKEKNALIQLSNNLDGDIKIDWISNINGYALNHILVQGKISNGQRIGNWIISEPVHLQKRDTILNDSFLVLNYEFGELKYIPHWKNEESLWINMYLFYLSEILGID